MDPTREDLQKIGDIICGEFTDLRFAFYAETSGVIFHHATGDEIMRLELIEFDEGENKGKGVGMAFQVETLNLDAVVLFNKAKAHYHNLWLLHSYYISRDKKLYTGAEAHAMCEQDKETAAKMQAMAEHKTKQIAEWELQKMERNGTLKVH